MNNQDNHKQVEEVRCPAKPTRWEFPLIAFTVGAVLAGSENRGIKAMGAGIVMASALSILKKLAALAD